MKNEKNEKKDERENDQKTKKKSKRSWLIATTRGNNTNFHYFIDTFGAISMTNQKTRTQIILDIDRKLSPDSYK